MSCHRRLTLLGCLVAVLAVGSLVSCEDDAEKTETAEKSETKEPVVTKWAIEYTGTIEGSHEGDRWELTETGDDHTLLVLRPTRESDEEFNKNTRFFVQLPAGKLGQTGTFDVPKGRAGFLLYEYGKRDHRCGPPGPTNLELETYTAERIEGSYRAEFECQKMPLSFEATFDINRADETSSGDKR